MAKAVPFSEKTKCLLFAEAGEALLAVRNVNAAIQRALHNTKQPCARGCSGQSNVHNRLEWTSCSIGRCNIEIFTSGFHNTCKTKARTICGSVTQYERTIWGMVQTFIFVRKANFGQPVEKKISQVSGSLRKGAKMKTRTFVLPTKGRWHMQPCSLSGQRGCHVRPTHASMRPRKQRHLEFWT